MNQKAWTLEIGSYPGVLFGLRTYEEPEHTTVCYTYLLLI